MRTHDRYDRFHTGDSRVHIGKTDVYQAITQERFAHETWNESNAAREQVDTEDIDNRFIGKGLLRLTLFARSSMFPVPPAAASTSF